jgi:hypothetical protein
MRKRGDEPGSDRIGNRRHHNRDLVGQPPQRLCGRRRYRDHHFGVAGEQLLGKLGKAGVDTIGPAPFDDEVSTLDVTVVAKLPIEDSPLLGSHRAVALLEDGNAANPFARLAERAGDHGAQCCEEQ